MAQHPPQSAPEGAPEWMVSYADMITIMMAFFVVLYASTSSSNTGGGKKGSGKEEKGPRSQAEARMGEVLDSLYYRFGPEWTIKNCWVGGSGSRRKPSPARARFEDGPSKSANAGWENPNNDGVRVPILQPDQTLAAGVRVRFDEDSATLNESETGTLRALAKEYGGRMQKIEIRGHTSRRPLAPGSPFRDHMDLAYARCRSVRDYLISQGIDARRMRLAVAGENEPLGSDADPRLSSRVEVQLLNEYVRDATGVQESRQQATPATAQGSEGL